MINLSSKTCDYWHLKTFLTCIYFSSRFMVVTLNFIKKEPRDSKVDVVIAHD